MKTNISDDLLASKIGSVKSLNNNSSLEYAIGAECLQAAAITTGILNEEGAAVGHEQALTEAPAGEPSIDHYEGININTWNSSSTFSNKSFNSAGQLKDEEVELSGEDQNKSKSTHILISRGEVEDDIVYPNDQFGRGGCLTNSPNGEKASILELEAQDNIFGDIFITPTRGTPKRRLSPDNSTPLGRVQKLSTTMEASPKLRDQLVFYQTENRPAQCIEAPDLIRGIGRLQLRPTLTSNGQNQENMEVTGLAQGSQTLEIQRPETFIQRIMRGAGRPRALSAGRRARRRLNRDNVEARSRSVSVQQRIDLMLNQSNHCLEKKNGFNDDTSKN